MCCVILRFLYILCLNKEPEILHFLSEDNGIEMLGYIFEKFGKYGKFSGEFVKLLFEIIESPTVLTSRLNAIVPLMFSKIVFNMKIWSNSDYTVQIMVIQRTREMLMNNYEIEFNAEELCNGLLFMLYDYFAPEEADKEEAKEHLKEIRVLLKDLILEYLERKNDEAIISSVVKFLLAGSNYCYAIRDLLQLILIYRSKNKKLWDDLVVKHLCKVQKEKKEDCNILTALHMLISSSIKEKNSKLKDAEDVKSMELRKECFEDIIAYSVHTILSFDWMNIRESLIDNTFVDFIKKGYSNIMKSNEEKPGQLKVTMQYLTSIKLKKDIEGNFLCFLFFHSLPNIKEKYQKEYLGESTYYALLSHLTKNPLIFHFDRRGIQKAVQEMTDLDTKRNKRIYSKLIENIRAFEPDVKLTILKDCLIFFGSKPFLVMFLKLKGLFREVCNCLGKVKYLENKVLKERLEVLHFKFLSDYWQNHYWHKFTFWNKSCSQLNEVFSLFIPFLEYILKSTSSFLKPHCLAVAIQFTYFLEDVVVQYPDIIAQKLFLEIFGKYVIYLSEVKMLYYYYPPLLSGFITQLEVPNILSATQREGGIARIIFKLILKAIIKVNGSELDENYRKLPFKLLSFFIFHKVKTLGTIKKILGVNLPPAGSEATSFLDLPAKNNTFNTLLKTLKGESTLSQMGNFEDQMKQVSGKKDLMSTKEFRLALVYTELVQVLLYLSYNVNSYNQLLEKLNTEANINKKITYITKLLGKILKRYFANASMDWKKVFDNLDKKLIKGPVCMIYPIAMCLSNIDECDLDTINKLHPNIDYPVSVSNVISNKAFTPSPLTVNDIPRFLNYKELQSKILKLFNELAQYYIEFEEKKITLDEYVKKFIKIISNEVVLKDVQAGLHKFFTDDFLQIEKILLKYTIERLKEGKKTSNPKAQSDEAKKVVQGFQDSIKEYNLANTRNPILLNAFSEVVRGKKEYTQLSKDVFSEFACSRSKFNEKTYAICSGYYRKLLNRCSLYKKTQSGKCALQFSNFVKLDMAKDLLHRSMRLKPIKNPLDDYSILQKLSYVRQYMLKRYLLRNIEKKLKNEDKFLVPNKYHYQLLKRLISVCMMPGKISIGEMSSQKINPKKPNVTNAHVIKSCVTRSQLERECRVKIKPLRVAIRSELIRLDDTIFGVLRIGQKELVFSSKVKNSANNDYRLGPIPNTDKTDYRKIKKIWKYSDITRITAQNYNMIRQGIEIRMKNRKRVLLVLFSEAYVDEFFNYLELHMQAIIKIRGKPITFVKDIKKEFAVRKFTDNWRKRQISNFQYLMILNKYSGRSFNSLAQYPVFPWILVDFSSTLKLPSDKLRDLNLPIAAINQKKRDAAIKKYENTDDFPGGRFQFGSHYLPGRAVLGYLLRLEPYTKAVYIFDKKEDCPSRYFHSLENMWKSVNIQIDTNLELIPEFYYLPDFLANQYKFNINY